eukprot:COSAG03_NODE_326_length_8956_cov_4.802077_2_plen_84_part_00
MIAFVAPFTAVCATERHKADGVTLTCHALALGCAACVAAVASVSLGEEHWVRPAAGGAGKQAAQAGAVAHRDHQFFKDHLPVL